MTNVLWFSDVRVVDVVSGSVSDPKAVAVENDRIAAFAANAPADGINLGACGLFLAPGLIDAHIHLFLSGDASPLQTYASSSDEEKLATAERNARVALQAGITTVRDCGAPGLLMGEFKARVRRGFTLGPHLVTCGAPLTRRCGHLSFLGGEVSTLTEVRNAVVRQLNGGHEFIKLIASGGGLTPGTDPAEADFPEPMIYEAVEIAHSNGACVAAHCHATESIVRALNAGVDVIEHASFVNRNGYAYDPDVACRLRDAGRVVDPTVTGALQSAAEFRRLGHSYNETDHAAIARLEGRLQNTARFRELGMKLVAGTDAGITNTRFDSLVDELLAYVSVGFSPAEALRTASSDAALHLRLGKRGQVRVGWHADLLLLDRNPVEDLGALRKPLLVMKSGHIIHTDRQHVMAPVFAI